MPRRKYCVPCEATVYPAKDGDCPNCGAGLDTLPREDQREKGDDDGREYGHPADAIAERLED